MGQGFTLAIVGVVLGAIAGLALLRVRSNLLFTVSATDPKDFYWCGTTLYSSCFTCLLPACAEGDDGEADDRVGQRIARGPSAFASSTNGIRVICTRH